MPKVVFADAAFWIARFSKRDSFHTKAKELSEDIKKNKTQIITSEMVLSELLDGVATKNPSMRTEIAEVIKHIPKDNTIEVIPMSHEQFVEALDLYHSREDKEWGVTDCSSICIMQTKEIKEVLTTDHHFEQAGYKILMKE